MTSPTVQYNQELIDIAMQELGDSPRVFDLSLELDRSITDHLTPGEVITTNYEPHNAEARKISRLLKKPINIPASGDPETPEEKFEGLEIWLLEADFIIT